MNAIQNTAAIRDLRTLFGVGALGTLSDGQLLDRFVARRDEVAFEVLMVRHGPMVWGVCRRVLHDAEDGCRRRSSSSPGKRHRSGHAKCSLTGCMAWPTRRP